MKRAEVQLPDPLYQQVEGLAKQQHLSVADLLRRAAEQLVQRESLPTAKPAHQWRLPEGRHMGGFKSTAEKWRLQAQEPGSE